MGSALLLSFHTTRIEQVAVLICSYLLLTFVILSFNGRLERDLFNLSGRYVLPIISFVVGYSVYLSKSPFQLIQIKKLRMIIICLLSLIHFLSLYSVVETNVDGQSHSIELISIGAGGWWWTGLPLGPNFVVIFGSALFTWFLVNAWSSVATIQIGVINTSREKAND